MALKAHFALLAFIVCTSFKSLHPSWISKTSARFSNAAVSAHFPKVIKCASHLSMSPCKLKYRCALLEYWSAVLKTSVAQLFIMALRTSESSTACFWSTTLYTSKISLPPSQISPLRLGILQLFKYSG